MTKSELIFAVCKRVEDDLLVLKTAAAAAHEAATSSENKAENQYDTRGIEASYLAGAQAKRVAELEEILVACRATHPKEFAADEVIAPTALVGLSFGSKKSVVLILAKGAGMSIDFDGVTVQTITTISPLGDALIGSRVGDTVEVEQNGSIREYKIISLR